LRGDPPAAFTGDRDKSDDFLREFDMYRSLNELHELMTVPYFRAMLALSYMKGPRVSDWVRDQINELREKTTRQVNPIDRTDNALWNDFEAAFTRTYTDTAAQQTAYHKLQKCKMKGDDLDTYIATFQHLAIKAGFARDAAATVDKFARGLNSKLLSDIFDKEAVVPTTFDGWVDAARRQLQKTAYKQAMMRPDQKWFQFQPQHQGNGRHHKRHPNDESVPMDVDDDTYTRIYKAYSDSDKKKHRAEGRCYECSQQGHMAKHCPNRKRQPFKQTQGHYKKGSNFQQRSKYKSDRKPKYNFQKSKRFPSQSHARAAQIEEISSDEENNDPEEDLDIPSIAARTAQFTEEEKQEWVKEMTSHGINFH
jgi:hypothetical protein